MRSALASPVQAAGEAAGQGAPRTAAGAVAAVLSESTADRAKAQSVALGLGLRDELLAWKTLAVRGLDLQMQPAQPLRLSVDRKSTRLNSSHLVISYAVFCLKKK